MITPQVFYGVVVSIMDPDELGRIQVRIPEIHGPMVPDEDLPWCYIMLGTPGSSLGEGTSPTGFRPGDNVAGFFRDESKQNPVVCWTWAGDGDINPLVFGKDNPTTQKVKDKKTSVTEPAVEFTEPVTDFSQSKYPYNHVTVSRSGHVVEVDDSEGQERLSWIHRLGSYFEYQADGKVIDKTVADRYTITDGDHYVNTKGRIKGQHDGPSAVKYGASLYVKSAKLQSYVSRGDMLFKADGIAELRAEILNVIASLAVSDEITVPVLKADRVIANDIQCAGIIQGTAKYAMSAGKAGSLGPVNPATGKGPGNVNTYGKIKDTDGYD